ncbi:MAG: hypothetical protein GY743_21300 [Planctomycetaceae bacterium]|nr:hypothetical protein [Planctomycetaceae bacterium]
MKEASDKADADHMQWFCEFANHSAVCLDNNDSTKESDALAKTLDYTEFGYLSNKDKLLLQDAITSRCDTFLTMERRLPKNSAHINRNLKIVVLTPIEHWKILQPWAGLWL